MGKRTVLDARVTDVERRRAPSKHYVYLITVTWSDNAVNIIYRRYSKFFDFQMKLFALFPEEAGAKNPSQRMIPFLPGKKLFGRSHTREVAMRRQGPLDEYCRQLVRLPPKISDCDEVINFFSPTNEDINPPKEDEPKRKKEKGDIEQISDPIQSEQHTVVADYKKQQKNEVDLHAGDIVEVFEKGENGWWFVSSNDSQGWAPGTFLASTDGQDEETLTPCDELFITNNEYVAQQQDEVSFQRGVVLNVIQKSLDGWWKVRYQEKEGWVPATFLQEYRGPNTVATPNAATEIIGNVMNISDLESRKTRPLPITPSGVSGTTDDRKNLARAVGGTDVKPTPPRRKTVRKTVRRGGTRIKTRAISEYYTVADFAGSSTDDSIPFLEGQKVKVLQQTDSGWWFVQIGEEEGWAPSTFIEGRTAKPTKTNNVSGVRTSNISLTSLDEETGERKPKSNTKPQIGSNNGAFTPVSPRSKRPLPNIPAVDSASAQNSAQKKDKPKPPPVPSKPKSTSVDLGNQGRGVDALRQQLEQRLATRESNPAPPPAPLKTKTNTASSPSPPISNRATENWITVASYDKEQDTEIGFTEGTQVEIVEKDDSGWWLIRIGAEEGWAPSTFLEKV